MNYFLEKANRFDGLVMYNEVSVLNLDYGRSKRKHYRI